MDTTDTRTRLDGIERLQLDYHPEPNTPFRASYAHLVALSRLDPILARAGIDTISELRAALAAGTIEQIRGIGAMRARVLREALARHDGPRLELVELHLAGHDLDVNDLDGV